MLIVINRDLVSLKYGGSSPSMFTTKQFSRVFTNRKTNPTQRVNTRVGRSVQYDSGVIASYTPVTRRLLVGIQSIIY